MELLLGQFSREFATSNPGPFGTNTTRTLLTGTAWLDNPGRKGKALPVFALMFLAVTLVVLMACANVGNPQSLRERSRRSDRDAGHAHLDRTRSRQPGAELPVDQRLVFVTCELDHLSTARYHGPQ